MITTVPTDVPHGMVPAYLEGVRIGMLRDTDSGYQSQIDELEFQMDDVKYYSPTLERELEEYRKMQVFFERGFTEGKVKRNRLKGGT